MKPSDTREDKPQPFQVGERVTVDPSHMLGAGLEKGGIYIVTRVWLESGEWFIATREKGALSKYYAWRFLRALPPVPYAALKGVLERLRPYNTRAADEAVIAEVLALCEKAMQQ